MARNPRWNPMPGDLLAKGKPRGLLERTVVAVNDGKITFVAKGKRHTTPVKTWREWAADARVAKIAMDTT